MRLRKKIAWLCLLVVMLAGCGGFGYHRVQPGETLYSISWRYGLDYREVARWNGLKSPYLIFKGQRLRIAPPAGRKSKVVASAGPTSSGVADLTPPSHGAPIGAPSSAKLQWHWPAKGNLVQTFSASDIARKGIDIGGSLGEEIHAAAAGKVVYAGSGLLNYGKLIILKHNDNYLSAYAYNQTLQVKEGDTVVAGQHIADMGGKSNSGALLHFEIRYDGQPVNPLNYLPSSRR